MQTFLPFPDFVASAQVLDRQRLGKQRVENYQIMQTLLVVNPEKKGWTNHPAVRMWRGHEFGLLLYQQAICDEWVARGYVDNTFNKTAQLYSQHEYLGKHLYPFWLGDPAFHIAHQSNLLRKDLTAYERHFPGVPTDLEYVWPV